MNELTAQIERLNPMHVAAVSVTSESPESDSMEALLGWARRYRLVNASSRFFGYDNCQPHPNHTYTSWLTVDADFVPGEGIDIVDFPGGKFLVTEVQGVQNISTAWRQLERLTQEAGYQHGDQPGLEECLDAFSDKLPSEWRFRLYGSIKE